MSLEKAASVTLAPSRAAQLDSKDFPIVSRHFFDSCFFCRALLSEEGQTASL